MWLLLAGCAPGPFTEEEAEAVYTAVSTVNDDVYALVWARTKPLPTDELDTALPAGAKGMQWHTGTAGGTYEGTVDGPGSWSGSVALTGEYGYVEEDGTISAYTWSSEVGYDEVGFGDVGFDGTATWEIEARYDGSRITHTSTLVGELVGSGSAAGSGAIDTTTIVSLKGGQYTVAVVGTVGGWPIDRAYDATAYGL